MSARPRTRRGAPVVAPLLVPALAGAAAGFVGAFAVALGRPRPLMIYGPAVPDPPRTSSTDLPVVDLRPDRAPVDRGRTLALPAPRTLRSARWRGGVPA